METELAKDDMNIKSIFCDIGGVCLTNGWEAPSRNKAVQRFSLDSHQMEKRHEAFFPSMERGEISFHTYLNNVVFYQERSFTHEEFIRFVYNESRPYEESLMALKQLRRSGRYVLSALNNEFFELNDFRIRNFGLCECFQNFFTSCFLGVRKPDSRIYEIALKVTQQRPEESLFIDDREENILSAQALNINTILLTKPQDLSQALRDHGITF